MKKLQMLTSINAHETTDSAAVDRPYAEQTVRMLDENGRPTQRMKRPRSSIFSGSENIFEGGLKLMIVDE